jgi:5-methylcytosine-specific restriction protein A
MILFKNTADTLEGVIKNSMHATNGRPKNITPGEIILIAQTKKTLLPGQKPVRWIMEYVSCEEDLRGISKGIWGKSWRYIIKGKNLRPVEPFDIDEIKVTEKNYSSVETHCPVEFEDEVAVLNWINESMDSHEEKCDFLSEEFEAKAKDYKQLLEYLDEKYSNAPDFKRTVVRYIQRPSALSNAIKERYGYTCMICGFPGFTKKGGGKYAEVHHMIELNSMAPKTLQTWNLLVVCPLCHKKLHYGEVISEFLAPGWKIQIDGKEILIK